MPPILDWKQRESALTTLAASGVLGGGESPPRVIAGVGRPVAVAHTAPVSSDAEEEVEMANGRHRIATAFAAVALVAQVVLVPATVTLAAVPQVVDDFEAGLPAGSAGGIPVGFSTFNDPSSTVAISTTTATPADSVPGATTGNHALRMDVSVVSYAGFVHNFENATADAWVTQDWSAYEGISFWLHGNNSGTTLFVDVLDNRNPGSTTDDAERWSVDVVDNFSGWQEIQLPFADMHRKEIGNGAPNDGFGLTEVHGWALGAITTPSPQTWYVDDVTLYGTAPVKPLTVGFSAATFTVTEGGTATVTAKLSKPSADPVTVDYATTLATAVADRDYTPVAGTLTFPANVTLQSFTVATVDDAKHQGMRGVVVELSNPTGGLALGAPPVARVEIEDNDAYDPLLLEDFESYPYPWSAGANAVLTNPEIASASPQALPGQGAYEHILAVTQPQSRAASQFGRTYPVAQDWSESGGLSFWYYGQDTGKRVAVTLTNNSAATRAAATNPAKWKLVWSDEFNGTAGTAPDPATWGNEVGDGTAYGIPGWGNDELEYYTPGGGNAALDGSGNLAITTRQADGTLSCYYGPCEYTSARLLTKQRLEVAYGRIETRVKVPTGAGLWPAFWMLGTNIDQVGWPQTGEIDIMEHVGRLPNEIFGTLHGPGYSGGQSYGQSVDLGVPVAAGFHTFAVEWQPDRITWLLDDEPYFTASASDPFLAGKAWVFNHPFYLLLNVAVGGNFGGAVGPETTFPQTTLVDYVRVYQAKPVDATYTASFTDSFTGWKQVSLPFSAFGGGDGSTPDLTRITGMSFLVPGGMPKPVMLDQIRLSCPADVTVTSAADSGAGSLRRALATVCTGGTIHAAPSLAGQTITLATGPLTVGRDVTIDASDASGLKVSGSHADRVLVVNAGTTASVEHLAITDGYGWQLAGGILNNGDLTLDHVTVTGNTMATDAGDYWQGGGGVYNGDGATLRLVDSTVADNQAAWSGGGVYSFFNTTTTIIRSTISGNASSDVGGAIRSLGDMTITNSTISGNTATGWHGGAIFQTDGDITIASSTIADNVAPDWASSTLFIGQFGGGFVPTLTLANTVITGNHWYACEKSASGTTGNVVSGGHNVVQDDSCNPAASDLVTGDALIGPLADNGGPTLTRALLAGSPAIDAADDAACPATDQRGVARPQGPHCDIGAVEIESPAP
jgi:beta-glucanase (GH16 family)